MSSLPARAQVASITCTAGATNSLTIPYSNGNFLQVSVIVASGNTLLIVFSPIGSVTIGLIDFQGNVIMNPPGDLTETLPGGSSGDVSGSIAADGTFSFTCNGGTPPPGGGTTGGIPNPDPHVDAVNPVDVSVFFYKLPIKNKKSVCRSLRIRLNTLSEYVHELRSDLIRLGSKRDDFRDPKNLEETFGRKLGLEGLGVLFDIENELEIEYRKKKQTLKSQQEKRRKLAEQLFRQCRKKSSTYTTGFDLQSNFSRSNLLSGKQNSLSVASRLTPTANTTTAVQVGNSTVFIRGSGGAFRDNQSGADRKGGSGGVTMGFSRPLSKRTSFGAFASVRAAQSKSTALTEKLDLTALGVGGFLRYQLNNTYSLVGGFLYERGSNKFRSGAITAKFDTDRILFNGRFEGTWQQGNLTFTPSLGFSWQNVSRERYTDSGGNVVAQRNLSTGKISPQINISYTHVPVGKPSVLFVRPYVAISGNWNFDDEKNFITKTGVIILDDNELYAAVTGGVSVSLVDGTTGNLSASFSGIGGDVSSILFSGNMAMPLGVLGFDGPTGSRLGLNLTSSPNGASRGMLEVSIPLN